MTELQKIEKKLRNLKQNKDKTEEEISFLAQEELNRKKIIGSLTFCITNEERKFATNLLTKYLEESSIESNADRDTLRQLIDFEILVERIKSYLNIEYGKANPAIPTHMLDELRKNNELILKLKESLRLINQEKTQSSWVETWEMLKKKALKYYETHAGCNTTKCPECQNVFRLMMDTTDLKIGKETFFRGTILYNEPLYGLYHQKKLAKEEMAEVFGVSPDFIDFLYNWIYLKERQNK